MADHYIDSVEQYSEKQSVFLCHRSQSKGPNSMDSIGSQQEQAQRDKYCSLSHKSNKMVDSFHVKWQARKAKRGPSPYLSNFTHALNDASYCPFRKTVSTILSLIW